MNIFPKAKKSSGLSRRSKLYMGQCQQALAEEAGEDEQHGKLFKWQCRNAQVTVNNVLRAAYAEPNVALISDVSHIPLPSGLRHTLPLVCMLLYQQEPSTALPLSLSASLPFCTGCSSSARYCADIGNARGLCDCRFPSAGRPPNKISHAFDNALVG